MDKVPLIGSEETVLCMPVEIMGTMMLIPSEEYGFLDGRERCWWEPIEDEV